MSGSVGSWLHAIHAALVVLLASFHAPSHSSDPIPSQCTVRAKRELSALNTLGVRVHSVHGHSSCQMRSPGPRRACACALGRSTRLGVLATLSEVSHPVLCMSSSVDPPATSQPSAN